LLLLLRRTRGTLLLLIALASLLRLLLLLLLLLRLPGTPAALLPAAAILAPRRGILLLELLDFARHELARLRVLLYRFLIVTAVRTPPPTLGESLFTGGAENAFRQRHGKSARIVHFGPMATGEERRNTISTLIDLAEGSNPSDCWDDRRAEDLLRSQSNAEEARELGMSEGMI